MTTDSKEIPDLADVSQAYARAQFTEEPPAHVDRAVKLAAQRTARRGLLAGPRRWMLPAAVAASVLIGVGMILRGGEQAPSPALPSAAIPADAASVRDRETASVPAERNTGTRGAAKITPDAEPLPALDTSAETAERPTDCADTSTPNAWLNCISTLARDGRAVEAAREIAAFRARFADYPLPADLEPQELR